MVTPFDAREVHRLAATMFTDMMGYQLLRRYVSPAEINQAVEHRGHRAGHPRHPR